MLLELVAIPLLDEFARAEDIEEVVRLDLGKVVGDDDGGLVFPEALDRLEDQDAGGRVQRGRSLICDLFSKCTLEHIRLTHQE